MDGLGLVRLTGGRSEGYHDSVVIGRIRGWRLAAGGWRLAAGGWRLKSNRVGDRESLIANR